MAKIILVDIDNVLADFDKAVLDVLKNEGIKKPDFKDFYIVNNFKEEYKEKIESIYLEPGFFANLKQIPNAIQGISRLEKEGFTVFLCSSLLYANPKALEDRRFWIVSNLGESFLKKTIFSSDKTLIRGDYLIDDKPYIKGVLDPIWKHVIYRQPYNQTVESEYELKNWSRNELERFILEVKE